jgi:hypothetical protein
MPDGEAGAILNRCAAAWHLKDRDDQNRQWHNRNHCRQQPVDELPRKIHSPLMPPYLYRMTRQGILIWDKNRYKQDEPNSQSHHIKKQPRSEDC